MSQFQEQRASASANQFVFKYLSNNRELLSAFSLVDSVFCKPSTSSRNCITVSNFPNPRVQLRPSKNVKSALYGSSYICDERTGNFLGASYYSAHAYGRDEMFGANSVQCACLLAFYRIISNACSWNNNQLITEIWTKTILFFFFLTAGEARRGGGFKQFRRRPNGKLYITNKQTLQLIQEKLYLSLK